MPLNPETVDRLLDLKNVADKNAAIKAKNKGAPAGFRYCGFCGELKSISEFYQVSAKRRLNPEYYRYCKPCAKIDVTARRYGITIQEYKQMVDLQKDRCAICGTPAGKNVLTVDHDHETGRVRGLLCNSCNSTLGWYERNREAAELYLAAVEGESHGR